MSNVQKAIRDAAEKGGYRYRWCKVNNLEHNSNCALYQSTCTTLIVSRMPANFSFAFRITAEIMS
jgi:hypothetical protein